MPASKKELYHCNNDDDCIKVHSGCCGCANQAINKKYIEEWDELRNFWCKGTGCTLGSDTSELCYADTKCINNSCNVPIINTKRSG